MGNKEGGREERKGSGKGWEERMEEGIRGRGRD